MKRFILPKFDPNRIFWWFSISGGKDSYTMSRVIWEWYKKHDYKFSGKGFFINQWKVSNYRYLKKKFFWMDIEEINAIETTEKTINYKSGQQAPCRECADIRRNINDRYIRDNFVPDKYNFIARGLHFSDTCISLLWRSVFSSTPFEDYSFQQKGFPIVELSEYTYLVKPLLFVREYESAQYAASCGFIPCCCGCPGCKYPSRRDIVEETVLKFYDADPLWEFQIPGIKKYLNQWDEELWDILQTQSLQGSVAKNNRIPDDFYDFALQSFEGRLNNTSLSSEELDENLFLDTIGTQWLLKTIRQPQNISRIPAPKLIKNTGLITPNEKRMIATLGPFWGAIGCSPQFQAKIWNLQKKIFDFEVDFEISVFYNQQEPDIVYYYDSRGQSFPSSTNNRKTNPNYYIEKGYAVVEFMRNPCAEVVVFDDICKYSYSFTNNQKSRIKSQAMFYMSHEGPYVLVIASNHKKTFDPKNKRSLQLVEALGNYIKADVLLRQTMEKCSKS